LPPKGAEIGPAAVVEIDDTIKPRFEKYEPDVAKHIANSAADAALDTTTAISGDFKLLGIFIHLTAAASPTITFKRISGDGASYDTVFYSTTLSTASDLTYVPEEGEYEFRNGDQIKIDVSATAGVTIYCTVLYKVI